MFVIAAKSNSSINRRAARPCGASQPFVAAGPYILLCVRNAMSRGSAKYFGASVLAIATVEFVVTLGVRRAS